MVLKEGHRLIRTGPYALARHPIYTGILTGLVGSALALGRLWGLIVLLLLTAMYYFKARSEERLLLTEFGEEYALYLRKVPMLAPIPRFPRQ